MGERGASEGRRRLGSGLGVDVWGDRADEMRRGVRGKTGEGRDGGGVGSRERGGEGWGEGSPRTGEGEFIRLGEERVADPDEQVER